jgi:hypothetical protein
MLGRSWRLDCKFGSTADECSIRTEYREIVSAAVGRIEVLQLIVWEHLMTFLKLRCHQAEKQAIPLLVMGDRHVARHLVTGYAYLRPALTPTAAE